MVLQATRKNVQQNAFTMLIPMRSAWLQTLVFWNFFGCLFKLKILSSSTFVFSQGRTYRMNLFYGKRIMDKREDLVTCSSQSNL